MTWYGSFSLDIIEKILTEGKDKNKLAGWKPYVYQSPGPWRAGYGRKYLHFTDALHFYGCDELYTSIKRLCFSQINKYLTDYQVDNM